MRIGPNQITNTTVLLLFFAVTSFGQVMYPGDVNNNGVVNGVDVLFLGLAFGSTGPQREDEETDFEPQDLPIPWDDHFPNGLNFAYADCDGNGMVDEEDIEDAIEENWGKTHGTLMPDFMSADGNASFDPFLAFEPDQPTASGGQTVNVTVSLGTVDVPADQFHGISFSVDFAPGLIEDDDTEFEIPSNPWYDPTGNTATSFVYNEDDGDPKVEVAITKIDQNTSSGYGEIGTLSFVIIDDVVNALEIDDIFEVKDIILMNENMEAVPVTKDTTLTPTFNYNLPQEEIKIFPNPTQGHLHIASEKNAIIGYTLYTPLGRIVLQESFKSSYHGIRVGDLKIPNGLYFLKVLTQKGYISKEIIVDRK